MNSKVWQIINKKGKKKIIDVLLENRGIFSLRQKEEFLNPKKPEHLGLKELGISDKSVGRAIERIKTAIAKNEEIVVYGDYDVDGVCAAAALWECLYKFTSKISPHIPNRFSEGYGINPESVENLKFKIKNLKLIITVDNGIVAHEGIKKANMFGIDVIVTDHHTKEKKLPSAHSIIHTTKIGGAAIAWFFAREIDKKIKNPSQVANGKKQIPALELAALGTIADQLPLVGPNRSIAKWGLEELNKTRRLGLLALLDESGIAFKGSTLQGLPLKGVKIGTYEVNFVIAPRLNAAGRMEHAIDALRLICTRDPQRAKELASHLGRINKDRQKTVEEVVAKARSLAQAHLREPLIISGNYHEGVIGLVAGKLAEEFYRPAIVISKGKTFSKASARSIAGFNIIEVIRKIGGLIEGGGGHPMAAGFTIKTTNIEKFKSKFSAIAKKYLTKSVLWRKLRIDCELDFSEISQSLVDALETFTPTGLGNPTPVFATRKVMVLDAKAIGAEGKHLKLYLEASGIKFSAIGFGWGGLRPKLSPDKKVDVVYSIDENIWNGQTNLQLVIKDIKVLGSNS